MKKTINHPGITPELKESVLHVLCLRIITEATRKEVHAYQQSWIDQHKPLNAYRGKTDVVITNVKDAWLMEDEAFVKYDAHGREEALKLGYDKLEEGQCPLLVSENLLRQSERLMVEDALYLMKGATAEAIYRKPERWEKAHELIIGATVCFYGKEEFMQMAMDLANKEIK